MNHEAELAQLLIQMGADRGVDIETILTELSWAQFPSFVDAEAVRASLIDAVESWWRADLESRINQLRNQYVPGASESETFGANQVYEAAPSYEQVAPFEPAPEPIFEPVPEPFYELEPVPEPVYEPEPTPEPVYDPERTPEPAPVFDSMAPIAPAMKANPMAEPAPRIEPAPATSMPIPQPVEDATVEGMAVEATEAPKPPAMPSDATMIWNTRGG